jgi:signal transduction histidine kinase/CheY-like chemotaxis protein/HPt (histidine-containing phosphotransfer) domain-containing protein
MKSIRTRLLFYIVIASSVIAFAFILLLLWTNLQNNLDAADTRIEQMEVTVIPAIKGSLWKFDEDQLRISMESFLSLPEVIHVELSWQEAGSGIHRLALGEKPEDSDADRTVATRHHELIHQVENGEQYPLGELVLTTSAESSYTKLYKDAIYIALLQSLKTLLLSAIILFIFQRILTRHILDIAQQSRKINLSNLSTVFSLNRKKKAHDSHDELDEVVSSLNEMRQQIKDDIHLMQETDAQLASEIEKSREKEKLVFAAKKSDEEKSLFLASISHEIRTPMNAIMGFVHLLRDEDLSDTPREYIDYIDKSANSLLILIDHILDMSKLDAGKVELESIPFQITNVLDVSLATFSKQTEDKSLEFTFDVNESVPKYLWGDQTRLQQILNNLISNAIKFTERGKIEVRINNANSGVDDTAGDILNLEFTVKDSGIGIDPEYLPNLFDVFTQEDASTTRRYGGTGLGMPIVSKLVKLMGGDMAVESIVDSGTQVTFTLPFKPCTDVDYAQHNPTPRSASLPQYVDCHILVADDAEINQALMVSMLKNFGARVSVAENGQEVVEKVNREHFDLVLMDIQMPVMNGFEAAQKIREQDQFKHLPIIAITATVVEGFKDLCINAGMNDYLSKPFNPDELFEKIQNSVAKDKKLRRNTKIIKDRAQDHPEQLPGVDIATGLKRWPNDENEYFSKLLEFIEEIRDSRSQIGKLMELQEYTELRSYVHKITGSAAFLALDDLSETAAIIEKAILTTRPVTEMMLEQYSLSVTEVIENQDKIKTFTSKG